ncbi:hypothetical protein M885DRAFT_620160 [Pelagophyceae sp. CCMP2097]|nr:hypothetical protein M885DRAFT_620160 [Pelagophyceae sp. CCMP2097]
MKRVDLPRAGAEGAERARELVQRAGPPLKRAADHAKHAARRSVRSAQALSQTDAARFVGHVVAEAARYALERTRVALRRIQTHGCDADKHRWAYADEFFDERRWLTLGWYERELVRGGDAAPVLGGENTHNGANDSEATFAAWARDLSTSNGEEAACYLSLLAVRTPAAWQLGSRCRICSAAFGAALHRHHCRMCGGSICRNHGARFRELPTVAAHLGPGALRVCDGCDASLDALARAERCAWRVLRVLALLAPVAATLKLRPFFDVPHDTSMHKARRCLRGVVAVARSCPLLTPASATVAVEVLEILCRYGPAGLATLVLRKEFVEAAELLRRVAGVDAAWPLSAHELTAAIYYLLALRRGERGAQPDAERLKFQSREHVSRAELRALRRFASIALWCYCDSATAVQLLAEQQGLKLLFDKGFSKLTPNATPSHHEDAVAEPAFVCLATPAHADAAHRAAFGSRRLAVIAVRGTASVHDVATDIRVAPVPFPPTTAAPRARRAEAGGGSPEGGSDGSSDSEGNAEWTSVGDTFAFAGMARAAQWLHEETAPALVALAAAGYDIVITGHSLGGGVAALCTVLLRDHLDRQGYAAAKLKCYGFATPACVDRALAVRCTVGGLVTSVVLHDDVVPRLTARSLRSLMAELLRQRETCMQHWRDDLDAVWTRLRHGLWAPKWRDSLLHDSDHARDKARIGAAPGAAHGFDAAPGGGLLDSDGDFPTAASGDDAARAARSSDEFETTRVKLLARGSERGAARPDRRGVDEEDDSKGDNSSDSDDAAGTGSGSSSSTAADDDDAPARSLGDGASERYCTLFETVAPQFAFGAARPSGEVSSDEDVGSRPRGRADEATRPFLQDFDASPCVPRCPPTAAAAPRAEGRRPEELSAARLSRSAAKAARLRRRADRARRRDAGRALVAVRLAGVAAADCPDAASDADETSSSSSSSDDSVLFHDCASTVHLDRGKLRLFDAAQINLFDAAPLDAAPLDATAAAPAAREAREALAVAPRGTGAARPGAASDGDDAESSSQRGDSDDGDERDASDCAAGDDAWDGGATAAAAARRRSAFEPRAPSPASPARPQHRAAAEPPSPAPWADRSTAAADFSPKRAAAATDDDERDEDDYDDALPELFVPGRVVLLYSWRGVYEAAVVAPDCQDLAEIAVSANMIADHSIQAYLDAVTEVAAARNAPKAPPPWQPFDATDACGACRAQFTWHTTSATATAAFREKHNCRECGLLVCDPCSRRRKPLSHVGLLVPSRVCDRCFFRGNDDDADDANDDADDDAVHVFE